MSESSNRLKIVGIALCVLSTTALLMVPGRAPADSRPPLSGEFARQIKLIEDRPEFPDLPFKELLPDGKLGERRLSQFRGRVLVVTFWATWCGICAREMPTLDKLQESLGGEDILVVALAQDDRSSADVRAYLKKRNLANLRVFHDREGTLAAVLGIDGVPTSYVLDPQGRMIGVVKGRASWDTPEAQAFLRYLKRASAKTSSE